MFDIVTPGPVDQIVCLHIYDGYIRVLVFPLTYYSPYLIN